MYMPKSFFSFLLGVFIGVLGIYSYKSILPYQFPNQWEVTSKNLNTSGSYDSKEEIGVFHGKKVLSQKTEEKIEDKSVLGELSGVTKRIEVDLTNQKVYAFEDNKLVMEFLVSTGKWGRTPTGNFKIAYKTSSQKMSGGSSVLGTYYYLPNVQFVQFFGNEEIPWSRGFSFHGTYWHENFGQPMSHGCINMRNEDAQKLFYWSDPSLNGRSWTRVTEENQGTYVKIYGTTPDI